MASWQTKKLGDIAEIAKGKSLSKNDIVNDGRNECIHYGELFTKYGEIIKKVKSRTNLFDDVFLSQANDVLMPTSDVTPRGLATASYLPFNNVVIGGDVLVIRPKVDELDGRFFAYYVSADKRAILRLTTGSTIFHLYGSDMRKLKLNLPEKSEQERIVGVLEVWDEYIEKLEQKIALKEQLKKGLMQQLLTGKKCLPGFTDGWHDVKLLDLATINKGEQRNKSTLSKQKTDLKSYPVINGGISPSGYTDEFNTESMTITISEGGNSCGFVNLIDEAFWCGGHCYKLTEKQDVDKHFLFSLLKLHETRIMSMRVGSGLPNIQKSTVERMKFNTTSDYNEQVAVGKIINTLSEEVEQLKVMNGKIRLQKKYLLKNLITGAIRTPEDLKPLDTSHLERSAL